MLPPDGTVPLINIDYYRLLVSLINHAGETNIILMTKLIQKIFRAIPSGGQGGPPEI